MVKSKTTGSRKTGICTTKLQLLCALWKEGSGHPKSSSLDELNFSRIRKPRGKGLKLPYKWAEMLHTPAFSGIPKQRATKSQLAHKGAEMLHNPCILGDPQTKGDKSELD